MERKMNVKVYDKEEKSVKMYVSCPLTDNGRDYVKMTEIEGELYFEMRIDEEFYKSNIFFPIKRFVIVEMQRGW